MSASLILWIHRVEIQGPSHQNEMPMKGTLWSYRAQEQGCIQVLASSSFNHHRPPQGYTWPWCRAHSHHAVSYVVADCVLTHQCDTLLALYVRAYARCEEGGFESGQLPPITRMVLPLVLSTTWFMLHYTPEVSAASSQIGAAMPISPRSCSHRLHSPAQHSTAQHNFTA
jgi:hypothetical protein